MPAAARSARSRRWSLVGASATGARHVDGGQPCQDAFELRVGEDMAIIAVADGHGDRKHERSGRGARIAVEVATDLLHALGRDLALDPHPQVAAAVAQGVALHLPRRMAWEWNRRVKLHAGIEQPDGLWHEDVVLYGSTVLCALFTPLLAVFLQLGDGDTLLVDADGQVQRMFPHAQEGLWGTQTWSLCERGSATRARVRCVDTRFAPPRLGLLCTDGLRDSLRGEDDALDKVGSWFLSRLDQGGWDPVVDELPGWLSELSRRGNGDDATLGLVYWQPEQRRGDP